ncbi:MAG: hypothetical protein II500_04585 [Campylobacter sp.]|nr:hypothetical protein [Campylobacter sp.]
MSRLKLLPFVEKSSPLKDKINTFYGTSFFRNQKEEITDKSLYLSRRKIRFSDVENWIDRAICSKKR